MVRTPFKFRFRNLWRQRRWTWVVAGVVALLLLALAIPPVRHLILPGGKRQDSIGFGFRHSAAFTGEIRSDSAVSNSG